ncbi:MAG TPA: YIP1 family protein, partial [Thermomicrobiales bacterium]|nr:YIP1 family protein [Thermomicrobiales bacterium]
QRTYREIAVDPDATRQAAIVVTIVAIASAIGGAADGFSGAVVGLIGAFISWLLFTFVTWFFGTQLFGTPTTNANPESLLRTLGYAQAPSVLGILGFIPILGWVVSVIAGIWVIVTSVFAIRQVLGLSTGRAIITAVIAAIASGIIIGIVGVIFGIGFAIGTL